MDISNIKSHVNFLDLHKDGRITTYHQQILDQGIILDQEGVLMFDIAINQRS